MRLDAFGLETDLGELPRVGKLAFRVVTIAVTALVATRVRC